MCYAIPGKVIAVKKNKAIVDYFGDQRVAINPLKNLDVGDYCIIRGGIIMDKMTKEEALPMLENLKKEIAQNGS